MKKGENRKCLQCNKIFYIEPYRIKKEEGFFCSSKCFIKSGRLKNKGKTRFKKGNSGYWKNKNRSKKTKQKISKFFKGRFKGEKSSSWKGGRCRHMKGYIYIYQPNHPFSTKGGYIFEHRLIVEKHLGRYLKSTEYIHHKNGIKNDNRLKNLYLYLLGKNWHPQTCPKCNFKFSIK